MPEVPLAHSPAAAGQGKGHRHLPRSLVISVISAFWLAMMFCASFLVSGFTPVRFTPMLWLLLDALHAGDGDGSTQGAGADEEFELGHGKSLSVVWSQRAWTNHPG